MKESILSTLGIFFFTTTIDNNSNNHSYELLLLLIIVIIIITIIMISIIKEGKGKNSCNPETELFSDSVLIWSLVYPAGTLTAFTSPYPLHYISLATI